MSNHLDPDFPPPPDSDALAARLQARVDAIEAAPDLELELSSRRHHRVEPRPTVAVALGDHQAAVDDLNAQLEQLRTQLEVAFDDVESRIDAAVGKASEADVRAQAASAQAASVLGAVDELTAALASIADQADPATAQRLRDLARRLRTRLQAPDSPVDTPLGPPSARTSSVCIPPHPDSSAAAG